MNNVVQPGHFMELTTFVGILAGVLQAVIIGYVKVLWSNFQDVKKHGEAMAIELAQSKIRCASELAEFKLHCSLTYGTKDDMAKAMQHIDKAIEAVFAKLDRIEDKLDKKVDKE